LNRRDIKIPQISDRVQTFTDSVIRRMTRINDEYGAINLSQGFLTVGAAAPLQD